MSGIADRLTRKVQVHLGGRDWQLVVTHEVLLDCEALTGKKLLAGGEELKPSAKLVRALLYLMLRRAGSGLSPAQVGKFLTPDKAESFKSIVIDAWAASMPDTKPAKEDSEGDSRVLETIEAWAIARYDLGLSDQEWLDSTPRQIEELRKRRRWRLQYEEYLMAVIASTAANAPHWKPNQQAQARQYMTMYPLEDKAVSSIPKPGQGMLVAVFSQFPKRKRK